MAVHNHGTEDGPGIGCPEYRTAAGVLRGVCLNPGPFAIMHRATISAKGMGTIEPYCDHGPFDACRCMVP